MIEAVLYTYLNSNLDVPCYTEIPGNKPLEYVVIENTGTSRENWLYSSLIAIQSYSTSLEGAAVLNKRVMELMDDSVSLNEITSARLNSFYNYTEPGTRQYRYQAVYDVSHYDD